MKVVVILGGLGSQMFKYAFYLLLKEKTDDECYISTLPFQLMDMWNGYELEQIFGIDAPNIDDWIEGNNEGDSADYADIIQRNMYNRNPTLPTYRINRGQLIKWKENELSEIPLNLLKKIYRKIVKCYRKFIPDNNTYIDKYPENFAEIKGNVLYDEFNHTSDKYIKNSKYDLRDVFVFPPFTEKQNICLKEKISTTESVALHIRRSDHLYDNNELFARGYFIKAVEFLKSNVKNPLFCVFSEESDWCKANAETLGLDVHRDDIIFVDWNNGKNSFRDMQLMTYCKHNILAISSFSWWGYYLSNRSDKIVCAPKEYWFEVPYHF